MERIVEINNLDLNNVTPHSNSPLSASPLSPLEKIVQAKNRANLNNSNTIPASSTENNSSREIKESSDQKEDFSLTNDELFSPDNIMKGVFSELKSVINEKIFNTWFSAIKLISVQPVSVETGAYLNINIGCPNKFSQDHLKHQYYLQLENSFKKVTGTEVVIKFEVLDNVSNSKPTFKDSVDKAISKISSSIPVSQNQQAKASGTKTSVSAKIRQTPDESNLNFNYNFSNFVVGSCNQFAQAACIKVSESPGVAYNPLLIYGGVGLGKTHLANAIGNAARRRNKKVLLASSEKFVSELISSLKTNSMDKFKAKFRSIDVLIIDDIQFIIGKERTQEEFFHTFNELYSNQKQIIITSDKLPQELVGLEERLRTRFASGLSVDLQAPDFETRIAILIKKAEGFGLNLTYDVAKIIAERIDTNVRELEGALTRLQALCSLFNQNPTEDIARKVVDTISPVKIKEVTTDKIKEAVAKQFNVSINDLSGKRRTQNIALARQVAMFLCRKHTARSFPEIGAIFGGRDHSTVIHAIKTINDRMVSDDVLNENINSIISLIDRN